MGDNSDIFELDIPYLNINCEDHSGHNQISFVTKHQQLNHHHQLLQDLEREAQPCSISLEEQKNLVSSTSGDSSMCYARNSGGINFSAMSQPLTVPDYTNRVNGQTNGACYDAYANQNSMQSFNPVFQASRSFQNSPHNIADPTDILPSFGSSFVHPTSVINDGTSTDLTNSESLSRKQSPSLSSTHPTTTSDDSYNNNSSLGPHVASSCVVSENEIQSIINANISLLSTWQKQLEAMSTFYTKNILPKTPCVPAPFLSPPQHGLAQDQNSTIATDPSSIFNNFSHLLGGASYVDNGPTTNLLDLFAKINNPNPLVPPNSNATSSHSNANPQNGTEESGSFTVKLESSEAHQSPSGLSDKRVGSSGLAVCSLCGKTFKFKSNLHTHVKAVHKKIKPHTCPVCGKSFSLKQNMKTHAKNIHLRVASHSSNLSPTQQDPTTLSNGGCGGNGNPFNINDVKEEPLQSPFPSASCLDTVNPTNTDNTFSSLEDQYRNLLLSAAAAQVAIFGCSDPPTTNSTSSSAQLFQNDYHEEPDRTEISPSLREQHVGMAIAAVADPTYVPPFCRAKKKRKISQSYPNSKLTDSPPGSKSIDNDMDLGGDVKLFVPTSPHFESPLLNNTSTEQQSNSRGEHTPRPVGAPRRNVTDSRDLIYCPQCPKTFTLKGNFNVHLKIVHEKVREFACPFCSKRFGLKANMYMHVANVHKLRDPELSSPVNNFNDTTPANSLKRGRSSGKATRSLPAGDNSISAGSFSDSQSNIDPQTYNATEDQGKMTANLVLSPENADNMLAVASVYLQYLQQQQQQNQQFNLSKETVNNQNNLSFTQNHNSSSHIDGQNCDDHLYQQSDSCDREYQTYNENEVQQSKHFSDINDANYGRLISSSLNTLHDRRTSAIKE